MERHYVVVQWDQPGGGKTLARNGGLVDPRIDMARLVAHGTAVSQYLRQHLHHDRIVLVGHSFGSILGAKMIEARPDLYAAFVGTGMAGRTQLDWQRWAYADIMARAKAAGDAKGLAEMRDGAGPPPWADDSPQILHLVHAARPYLPPSLGYFDHLRILLATPHWSLEDILAVPHGMDGMLHTAVWKPEVRDAYLAGPVAFATPFLVIQGADDKTTPVVLARPWFDRVQAPAKAFVVMPSQGHEALSWDNAAFTQALDANLPLLLKTRVTRQ
jgi:pimeloyl-ACP methyl ester carboxylesterase